MSRNQGGQRWQTKLLVYVSAATAGGLLAGAGLGALGSMLPLTARAATATALGLLAVAFGTVELAGRRIRPLQFDRETPQRWLHRGPLQWAVRNGLVLGVGATTRLGFTLWYVVPLAALLTGSPEAGAVLYGGYAFVRAASVIALIVAIYATHDLGRVSDWAFGQAAAARSLAGGQLVVVGTAVATAVG